MNFFDLDPRQLPSAALYRVQYDGCETIYHPISGLTAQDTETFYDDYDDIFVDFGRAVKDHLCWRRVTSLFISLFADEQHAENWALHWSAHHGGRSCQVFEISASKMVGSYVFHADEIRKTLGLRVPPMAEASIPDEYLVAWNIPQRAIVGCQTTEHIQRGG
jgi:hypothetical protein